MNRGYIYFILLLILFSYLIYIYYPIVKKHTEKDKIEKEINETNNNSNYY